MNVTSLGDTTIQGGGLSAGKDVNVTALGNVALAGVQEHVMQQKSNSRTDTWTTRNLELQGQNVNVVGLGQGSDVTLAAVNVNATEKAKLSATGDVTIVSGEDRTVRQWTTKDEDCNWYGKCTTTVTQYLEDRTSQAPSVVKGGQSVEVSAGKDLTTVASRLESGGDLTVNVGGKANYNAALNVDRTETHSESSSSWGFGGLSISLDPLGALLPTKGSSDDKQLQTRASVTQLQSEADVLSNSGGDTLLQGTSVKAGGNVTFNAGVGPQADPNAKVIVQGVVETLQSSHTESSKSMVWQSTSGEGKTEQNLKYAQIDAKGAVKFNAPGGIDVQLPAGDPLKEQVKTLSQQPGMEWLNDLSQRKDVNWQQIKLAKDQWSYSQEGLTPAGAAVLTIAVAIATADTTGQTAAAITGSGSGVAYTATQAAMSAAISQAAVTLANNKGDIGKTLQDMGKSDNVKSLITTAVTAGALETVNPGWAKQLSATGDITQKAVINLTNAVVSATVKTAVQGGSYEDNLTQSLKTAGVDTAAGWAASNIGDGYKNGEGALSELQGQYIAHKVAHALLGCASATAKDTSCAAGAIGGAVGEAFAEFYSGEKDGSTLTAAQQQEVMNTSKLVVAAVAGLTGKDAQAAVDAAQVAVLNNWLFVSEEKALKAAKSACQTAGRYSSDCQRQAALEALDARRDAISKPLEAACMSGKVGSCELAQAYRVTELTSVLGQAEFARDELETLIRATTGAVTAESRGGNPLMINAQQNKDGSYKTDADGNLIVNLVNGKPDAGGLSYGLVQFASKAGGMQDFLSFLKSESGVSDDAKTAYSTLINAGGVDAAQKGTPAFVKAWQNLTQDPQFQIYQLEAEVRSGNMQSVEGYFQSMGINISDLDRAKQEVVVAMVVQRAKATKQDVSTAFLSVSEDAKKIYDGMVDSGALYKTDSLVSNLQKMNDAVSAAQEQLTAAEAARANAALKVIDLQEQAANAADVSAAKQALDQATQALDAASQKTDAANQQVVVAQQKLTQSGAQAQAIRDEWKEFFVDSAISKDASGKTVLSESLQALLAQVKKIDPGRAVTLEDVVRKLYPATR